MKRQIRRLLIAVQFLTIIPVKITGTIQEDDLGGSSLFFPLVGAVQGITVVLTFMALMMVLCRARTCQAPAGLISIVVILLLMVINKGLHIDGLADTFDALGVAPTGSTSSDIEKRLSVMKDSRIGAMGTVAIVGTVLIKYVLLSTLISDQQLAAVVLLLFLMPVYSKWTMVCALYRGTSARKDGIGRAFIEYSYPGHVLGATGILTVLTAGGVFVYRGVPGAGPASVYHLMALAGGMLAALFGFSVMSVHYFQKKFGGITGDTLGAISELSEVLFLFMAAAWLNH